mgnify:CR=1 FL=1
MEKLLELQKNDCEVLCKVLIDAGVISAEDCHHALDSFREKYRLDDLNKLNLLQTTKINITWEVIINAVKATQILSTIS